LRKKCECKGFSPKDEKDPVSLPILTGAERANTIVDEKLTQGRIRIEMTPTASESAFLSSLYQLLPTTAKDAHESRIVAECHIFEILERRFQALTYGIDWAF